MSSSAPVDGTRGARAHGGAEADATRPAAAPRVPGLLATALIIARKDLAIEFRTRTAFFSALVFALLGIVVFYFAWDPTSVAAFELAPGVLWVIFTFSGLLALQRSFSLELMDRAIDGVLSSPAPREAVYLGKVIANLVFVGAVQVVAIPAVGLFYNVPLAPVAGGLALVAALAAVGLVAVGTLFSAITVNTRLSELLLPVLSLPFFVPIVVPAAQSTARMLAGRPVAESLPWLKLLIAFDIVFLISCALAFPYTLEE
ncbi:MAG TPA: heme exporter protein CcmB [Gemmatimonadaceae bacterium]|nr:heme exporter protein CcmB [Gemmatimonadaceae bacterium]